MTATTSSVLLSSAPICRVITLSARLIISIAFSLSGLISFCAISGFSEAHMRFYFIDSHSLDFLLATNCLHLHLDYSIALNGSPPCQKLFIHLHWKPYEWSQCQHHQLLLPSPRLQSHILLPRQWQKCFKEIHVCLRSWSYFKLLMRPISWCSLPHSNSFLMGGLGSECKASFHHALAVMGIAVP